MSEMTPQTELPRLNRRVILKRHPIDGQAVKRLVTAGMTWLQTNRDIVNALNVFPVPDGDTGTNMMLTMKSAFEEIENSPENHAGKMLGAVAQGALMGARGNSGVILSQIWRGVANGVEGEAAITAKNLTAAFSNARDTAYKGVVKPVEGTILTVIKDVAAATEAALKNTDDPIEILEIAVQAADRSVQHTPELLPILKDAGVVDSGGKGLFFLLEGMVRWINGEKLSTPIAEMVELSGLDFDHAMEDVEEGQDYEVVVDFRPDKELDLQKFYAGLEEMGTSIQVGEGQGMYRMHIHVPTENRYIPIDYCMEFGTVTNVAIENLMAQMEDIEAAAHKKFDLAKVEPGQIAVIAVAPGAGFSEIFASLGVAGLVAGGQTMNPSTQDIMAAFENLPSDKIIVLPNNKNIVMAAKAAAELTVKQVRVLESRTVPQGLAALMRLMPDGDLDEVFEEMQAAMAEIETGEITVATRNVEIDGVECLEGSVIGLHNGKLRWSDDSIEKSVLGLLKRMKAEDYELITLYYGEGVNLAQAEEVAELIQDKYPDHEIEIQLGGQPHYQYIFGVE